MCHTSCDRPEPIARSGRPEVGKFSPRMYVPRIKLGHVNDCEIAIKTPCTLLSCMITTS